MISPFVVTALPSARPEIVAAAWAPIRSIWSCCNNNINNNDGDDDDGIVDNEDFENLQIYRVLSHSKVLIGFAYMCLY
jgi:hypothetical protein